MPGEVSTLALSLILAYADKRRPGASAQLAAGLRCPPAFLRSPRGWVDWDVCVEIMRRTAALFPGEPDVMAEIGRSVVRNDVLGFVRTMSFLLPGARPIYRMVSATVPQFFFRCVSIEYRDLGDREVEMVYALDPAVEPAREFFEVVRGILQTVPRFVGDDAASVGMTLDAAGRIATYRIRLAPSSGRMRRLGAVARNYVRFYPKAAKELEEAHRRLQEQYDELHGLYDELSRHRTHLEAMVDDRTARLSGANRTLEQTVARLEELDRAKSEFLANVSHELRTPLTMILGPVSSLLDGAAGPLGPAQRGLLGAASDHSKRLLRQVNNLLDISKIEAGRMRLRFEPTDIAALATTLVSSVRGAAEAAGQRIEIDPAPPLEPIHVDREQIDKALLNILGNAVKFTPAGGRIRVRIDETPAFVRIAVSDTGPGIAPEHRERIFERYGQVDGSTTRRHAGTGLGLALAGQIVALHAGHIDLDGEPGKGSTFTVWLPKGTDHVTPDVTDRRIEEVDVPVKRRATDVEVIQVSEVIADVREIHLADVAARDAAEGCAPPDAAAARAAGLPVALVVEDDPAVRGYLAFVLGERFAVETAADGLAGLAAADTLVPDVVLSDVMMPGIDGIELARRIRANARTARVPVVLLTARADPESLMRGLEAGADDYLVKPFSARELVARLTNAARLRIYERDIERRNAELERALGDLRRAQDDLLRSARMASLGQLVAGVAHEINNPLNFICGATAVIDEGLSAADPDRPIAVESMARLRRLAMVARVGCERIAGIVEGLRQFSGGGARTRARVDIADGIRLTVALLEPAVREAKVALEVDIEDPLVALCNPGEINQVVANLLSNAIAASPGGAVRVSCRREDGLIAVTIADTGPGIPEEILPRIFEPFFTTRDPGRGTGLGLTIADTIARAHGGRIDVSSTPGEGATFRFVLPAAPAMPEPPPSETREGDPR